MGIGENIKRFRLRKHMSQTELGDKVGVTYRMIQKYEASEDAPNSVIPSIDMVKKLAEALEVRFYDIVEEGPNKEETMSVKDYFNTITKKAPKFEIMSNSFDQLERDIFYYIFKKLYQDYHLEFLTGMDAIKFFNSDITFSNKIYEMFASCVVGSVTNNIIKIQTGKEKPHDDSSSYTTDMASEFEKFAQIYRAYLAFGVKEGMEMTDVFKNHLK